MSYEFPHADHLSPSSIGDYLRCPACFFYSRVQKYPYPMSVNLPLGGAVHKGIEQARRAIIANREADIEVDRYVEVAAEYFDSSLTVDEETGAEITLDLGRFDDPGKAKDATVTYTRYALTELIKLDRQRNIVAAEVDLKDFPNPWPFPMHGRIDALYGPDEESCNAGADLKTSSKQAMPDAFTSLQVGIYREYFPVTWFVDVLAKTRVPSLQAYVLTDDGQDYIRQTVMDVAKRISEGDFPARPSFYCKFSHGSPTFQVAVQGFAA